MLCKMTLEQKPANEEDGERLKATASKLVGSLKTLRGRKLRSGKTENDAEILFIDKLIGEFESDLQKR
ncbi:MAG: hypothetical protein LKJ59_06560 [Oscillospiraceae bacterium]|nr:hypothetical protein [Oscillospiraceae bacterium]MCI2035298.1 hypothetical protein [Oscillospiraceae bacterium]